MKYSERVKIINALTKGVDSMIIKLDIQISTKDALLNHYSFQRCKEEKFE